LKKTPYSHLTENDTAAVIRHRTNSFRTRYPSGSDEPADYEFSDAFEFIQSGIEAIVNDQVTQRFVAEELKSWNLLTRTNRHYEFISWRLSLVWVAGFFLRYCIMLPLRIAICFIGVLCLTLSTFLIGLIPFGWTKFRRDVYHFVCHHTFGLLSWAISAVIRHHDQENRPGSWKLTNDGKLIKAKDEHGYGGICVANHTSPIDVLVLAVDNTYDLIGQSHGGFLGVLQRALARASSHIWFERSEIKDRSAVARRLKAHVEDTTKLPILIFPEGTCINNSAVMQFKKGSFEVGGIIYPVAIKYDPRFGDPFWNSSEFSMLQYLYFMMTSWAIVCDVWYLPPMTRNPGECSVDFANRVKKEIAEKGGLVDLDWDGQLKRAPAKREWKEKQQLEYSKKFAISSRHIVSKTDATSDSPNPST
jgi:glycerol-3-phosphate O-acyltransferase 3/4